MAERLGHISGDDERASNMPCPECGAVSAEQTSRTLSDEELRRVARCVLETLRVEIQRECSHKAADRPTTVEQVPDSDDGSDGAMGSKSNKIETLKRSIEKGEFRTGHGIKVVRLDPTKRDRGFLVIKPLSTVPDSVAEQVEEFYATEDAEEWKMIRSVTE